MNETNDDGILAFQIEDDIRDCGIDIDSIDVDSKGFATVTLHVFELGKLIGLATRNAKRVSA